MSNTPSLPSRMRDTELYARHGSNLFQRTPASAGEMQSPLASREPSREASVSSPVKASAPDNLGLGIVTAAANITLNSTPPTSPLYPSHWSPEKIKEVEAAARARAQGTESPINRNVSGTGADTGAADTGNAAVGSEAKTPNTTIPRIRFDVPNHATNDSTVGSMNPLVGANRVAKEKPPTRIDIGTAARIEIETEAGAEIKREIAIIGIARAQEAEISREETAITETDIKTTDGLGPGEDRVNGLDRLAAPTTVIVIPITTTTGRGIAIQIVDTTTGTADTTDRLRRRCHLSTTFLKQLTLTIDAAFLSSSQLNSDSSCQTGASPQPSVGIPTPKDVDVVMRDAPSSPPVYQDRGIDGCNLVSLTVPNPPAKTPIRPEVIDVDAIAGRILEKLEEAVIIKKEKVKQEKTAKKEDKIKSERRKERKRKRKQAISEGQKNNTGSTSAPDKEQSALPTDLPMPDPESDDDDTDDEGAFCGNPRPVICPIAINRQMKHTKFAPIRKIVAFAKEFVPISPEPGDIIPVCSIFNHASEIPDTEPAFPVFLERQIAEWGYMGNYQFHEMTKPMSNKEIENLLTETLIDWWIDRLFSGSHTVDPKRARSPNAKPSVSREGVKSLAKQLVPDVLKRKAEVEALTHNQVRGYLRDGTVKLTWNFLTPVGFDYDLHRYLCNSQWPLEGGSKASAWDALKKKN
ncbi:hypothetical protein Dda_3312 [Drechslerella dactyloides]|uniref:DUF6697 domain-containing protein n=1 Tax=Drechslerella dactyloides TaxID=74499 RepID=A0AAD6J2B5_DREDA|nr:hypothetical protein Dda_3312 [Drechslerella dactyloides]